MSAVLDLENSKRPVNRLPLEVLAGVFETFTQTTLDLDACGFPFPEPYRPPKKDTVIRELLCCSHVCRYWRRVFDLFPRLSSTLILYGAYLADPPAHRHKLMKLFLSRSGTHPLEVHVSRHSSVSAIVEQSHRLRHLQIACGWDPSIQRLNVIMFRQPAPRLEYFDCSALEEIKAYTHIPRTYKLPVVFGGQVPLLRRLKLVGFSSWAGNAFHDLTHICLVGFQSSQPDFREILDLLHNCPFVQELYLASFSAPFIEDMARRTVVGERVMPAARPAKPIALRRLSLSKCNLPEIERILAYLQLPQDTHLYLSYPKHSRIEFGDVIDRFPSHFENLLDLHSLSLNLPRNEVMATGPSGSVRLPGHGLEMWHHFLSPFLAHALTELWIEGESSVAVKKWLKWGKIFAALPLLEKICMKSWYTTSIVGTLCSPPVGVSPSPAHVPQRAFCERLHTLFITEMWDPIRKKTSIAFLDLLHCLETRSARGLPIRHLKICLDPEPPTRRGGVAHIAWSSEDSKVSILRRYVDLIEKDVEYQGIEVSGEFQERTHPQYWPRWA